MWIKNIFMVLLHLFLSLVLEQHEGEKMMTKRSFTGELCLYNSAAVSGEGCERFFSCGNCENCINILCVYFMVFFMVLLLESLSMGE